MDNSRQDAQAQIVRIASGALLRRVLLGEIFDVSCIYCVAAYRSKALDSNARFRRAYGYGYRRNACVLWVQRMDSAFLLKHELSHAERLPTALFYFNAAYIRKEQ